MTQSLFAAPEQMVRVFTFGLSINVGRMRILWDGVDRWLSLGRSRPSFTRHSSLALEDDQFSPKKAALYKTLSRRPLILGERNSCEGGCCDQCEPTYGGGDRGGRRARTRHCARSRSQELSRLRNSL